MLLDKIIPIIAVFVLGSLLRKLRVFSKATGDILLKFVVYVSLPALTLISITSVELSYKFAFLPVIAAFTLFTNYFIASFIGRKLRLPQNTKGTFIIAAMIMNTGFTLPFISAAFGNSGIARVSIFELGNELFVFTFAYFVAIRHSKKKLDKKFVFRKIISLPPIWALLIGLIFNMTNNELPTLIFNTADILSKPTNSLIMFSLGLYFHPKANKVKYAFGAISLRMVGGLLIGIVLANLLGLDSMTKKVAIIGAGAPVGFNTLVFSTLEDLDKEFAAGIVSYSIGIGIVVIPVLLYLL